jgi:hypothetical protein
MPKPEISQSDLDQFTGTEHYYRYIGGMLLTDGAKFLAEKAGAFWLLDIIASYQKDKRILGNERLRDMQFWTLTVKPENAGGHKGVVVCQEDSDIPPVITQNIPFTDFPMPEVKLWVQRGEHLVIMLPSEY